MQANPEGMARILAAGGADEQQWTVPVLPGWQWRLIDTPEVHCRLDGLRVYPSSLRFRIIRILRPGAGAAACGAFEGPGRRPRGERFDAAKLLEGPLLGVRYTDGRGAALDLFGNFQTTLPQSGGFPVLELGSSTNSDSTGEHEVRLHGLPEQGSITVFWRWQAIGAAESSLELDGDALREASARARILWQEEAPSGKEP